MKGCIAAGEKGRLEEAGRDEEHSGQGDCEGRLANHTRPVISKQLKLKFHVTSEMAGGGRRSVRKDQEMFCCVWRPGKLELSKNVRNL